MRGARGSAENIKGQVLFLQGDVAGAEAAFQEAITRLDSLVTTTPQEDERTRAGVYLALGAANFAQAYTRFARDDQEGGGQNLRAALAAFDSCANMIAQDDPDAFLRTIVRPNCSCTRTEAQKALDGIR